jgi:hypothetical protein
MEILEKPDMGILEKPDMGILEIPRTDQTKMAETIPDFFPKPVFTRLLHLIFSGYFTWNFSTIIGSDKNYYKNSKDKQNSKEHDNKLFLLSHVVYEKMRYPNPSPEDQMIMSLLITDDAYYKSMHAYYDIIGETMPKGQYLEVPSSLDRIKINFYPNTSELHEHDMHRDYAHTHKGALLSLNTCDGYTKLEDGIKYPSVANTLLKFDTGKKHCSTTTTNAIGRFNININYT